MDNNDKIIVDRYDPSVGGSLSAASLTELVESLIPLLEENRDLRIRFRRAILTGN